MRTIKLNTEKLVKRIILTALFIALLLAGFEIISKGLEFVL